MSECPVVINKRCSKSYRIAADWHYEQGNIVRAKILRMMAERLDTMTDLNLKRGEIIQFYQTGKIITGKVVGVGPTAVTVLRTGRRRRTWVDALLIIDRYDPNE